MLDALAEIDIKSHITNITGKSTKPTNLKAVFEMNKNFWMSNLYAIIEACSAERFKFALVQVALEKESPCRVADEILSYRTI